LGIDHKVDVSAATLRNAVFYSRRAFLKTGLFTAAALPLAGCWGDGSVTRHVKIIATAEVDGKQVQGSTVMELKWRPAGDRMYQSDKGEALILELPGKGTVYVIDGVHEKSGNIGLGFMTTIVNQAVGVKWATARRSELHLIEAAKGRFVINPYSEDKYILLMVAFKDEDRKDSIYEVKPESFASHFGAGVKFMGLEFEFTDEPITDELKRRLPMIGRATPGSDFPADLPGKGRAYRTLPFAFNIYDNMFFSFGDY
jgi:hypothetical protein